MARILYITGAGLTKALEVPGFRVPLMEDFVAVLADYVHDDVILTTLAELENAGVYEHPSTEAAQLGSILTGQPAARTAENRERFQLALKNRVPESIEILLARTSGHGTGPGSLHQRFKFAINRLFCLVGSNWNQTLLSTFLRRQFALPSSTHTFIDFNYDLELDFIVQREAGSRWNVHAGYGFPIQWGVAGNLPELEHDGTSEWLDAVALRNGQNDEAVVLVLKPHGSLNWLVPFRSPYHSDHQGIQFKDGPVIVPLEAQGTLRYWCSTRTFQKIRCAQEHPRDVGTCILAPSNKEKETELSFLRTVRQREREAIAVADEVILIGWSMPTTDKDQINLIESAVRARQQPLARLTVVGRGSSEAYFRRIGSIFGARQDAMRTFNDGFEDFLRAPR